MFVTINLNYAIDDPSSIIMVMQIMLYSHKECTISQENISKFQYWVYINFLETEIQYEVNPGCMVSSWNLLQFHPGFYDIVEQIPAWKCKNPVLEIKFFCVCECHTKFDSSTFLS